MAVALRHTEDYAVETPAGRVGRVEEVRPDGLAVLTTAGTHALLRDRDVITVDRERRWVIVEEHPGLVELSTGGMVFPEPVDRLAGVRNFLHRHAVHVVDRPLWQLVVILYGAVSLIVIFGVALVFLIAWVATGSPY
jgi:hypothetical protein